MVCGVVFIGVCMLFGFLLLVVFIGVVGFVLIFIVVVM